ncbi:FxLD family lanthipeptide [Streptomyces sp. HUAS MG91]|uniref:FxLD family lanthipeptide n=1 Tax=Streptomyces tabacisoli TaxID=3156398 RepID=A0AAU8J3J6_9ACTN
MAPRNDAGTTKIQKPAAASDGFALDVVLLEVGDVAGLINLTDDGCGETCGACTTNVA